jgi:hypothetical protein
MYMYVARMGGSRGVRKQTNRPTDRPTNQPIKLTNKQPTNQPTNQPTSETNKQTIHPNHPSPPNIHPQDWVLSASVASHFEAFQQGFLKVRLLVREEREGRAEEE